MSVEKVFFFQTQTNNITYLRKTSRAGYIFNLNGFVVA